jgi:hypothetical protein
MTLSDLGRLIILLGFVLIIVGGIFLAIGRAPLFRHFGHLPGDIRIEGENYSCFFPLMSMIVISLLLSLALNIVIRLINR